MNLTFPVARYGVGLSFREVFGIEFCDTPQLAAGSFILAPPSDEAATPTSAWTLQTQCRRGEDRFAPSASTFSFIRALEQGRAVSSPLRAET
ncbi:MAG TPA: hypothetical protein VN666_12200 [Nitrospira sp.]|nr:hypothetical protein [Nitrospira sp.]